MQVPDRARESLHLEARPGQRIRWLAYLARSTDSYGLVMALIGLSYVGATLLDNASWGGVVIAALLGATLLLTLRTSRARRGLMLLATLFVGANLALAVVIALVPRDGAVSLLIPSIGGFLLICAPVVILRRIAAHPIVSVETILGAIDVYLLFGLIFSMLFHGVALIERAPFFAGVSQPTGNDYLFFSYTTLTTVGYGNLVPAGNLGRTMAMLEALMGQIYLVIVVARLVSLWGQARPKVDAPSSKRPMA